MKLGKLVVINDVYRQETELNSRNSNKNVTKIGLRNLYELFDGGRINVVFSNMVRQMVAELLEHLNVEAMG